VVIIEGLKDPTLISLCVALTSEFRKPNLFLIFVLGNCSIDQQSWDFLRVCETDGYFPLVKNLIDEGLHKHIIY
jgi:hypothetical protein